MITYEKIEILMHKIHVKMSPNAKRVTKKQSRENVRKNRVKSKEKERKVFLKM